MNLDHAPELHPGDSGEWVTYLQQLLTVGDHEHRHWNAVSANGIFDDATERAVRAFQAWVPMTVTGAVDAATWPHLARSAGIAEQMDETMAMVAGDKHAGEHARKVGPGEEVGRVGWRPANIRLLVEDFNGDPHNGPASVRFRSTLDSAESDESGQVDDGTLILSQVWIPWDGTVTLYVSAVQESVSNLHGSADLYKPPGGNELGYRVKQQCDTRVVTRSEALALAQQYGYKAAVGANVQQMLSAGLEATEQSTDTATYGETEMVTFRVPLPALTITPLA